MSSSSFWELTVGVSADLWEGLTNLVWELGALGVVEEEQPGQGARLRAFFPGTFLAGALEAKVRAYLDGLRELGFEPCPRRERGPARRRELGGRLARPFHSSARRTTAPDRFRRGRRRRQNGRMVITIDPGRAFGTGHHGSTLGCLEALEAVIERTARRG